MNKLNELLSKIISKLNISVKAEEQNFTEEQKAQIRENIGVGAAQIQADYTQNDSNASDYIKNRPFYTEKRLKTIEIDRSVEPKAVIKFADGNDWLIHASDEVMDITKEDLYGFSLNGEEKTPFGNNLDWSALSVTKSKLYNGIPCTIIGIAEQPALNFAVILDKDVTIGEEIYPHGTYFLNVGAGTSDYFYVDWIKFYEEVVHKLDPKYYDRLAWEEKEVVFEVSGEDEEWVIEAEGLFELKDGTEYLVKIDDVEYRQVAKSIYPDGITVVYVGNAVVLGDGVDTGEPFIFASVMGFSMGMLIDSNTGEYLSGYHEVSIIAQEVHKIEDKYLPDIAISHADMAESNPYAPSYVKNRSFYNGIAVNLQELVQAGAPTVTTGTNNALQFVKIADYFVPDDSILDTRLIINGKINSLRTDNTLNIKENGTWEIVGFDIRYMIGLTKSSIESGSVHGYTVSENFEDGVYFACKFLGIPVAGEVYLPITKKIDKDVVSLSYSDLSDIPFGDIPDKVVSFDVECVRNAASYIVKRKYNDDGSTKDITYRRAHAYISPRIGMTLLLSDESRMEISESDIEILQQNLAGSASGAEKDRYAIRDLIIFDKGDSVSHDSFSVSSDKVVSVNSKLPSGSAGIYLNLDADDGVYVTGIVTEDGYTKQLDTKFIPSELPAVTASDNGKFLRVSAEGKWVAQTILNAEEVAF